MNDLRLRNQDEEQIALRWAQYEAEARVNLLRSIGIAAFYLIHEIHYLASQTNNGLFIVLGMAEGDAPSPATHYAVTSVALVWLMVACGIHLLLRNQYFPKRLMYLATATDLVLLTCVLAIVKGPASPLICVYFLIVVMSGLRLDLVFVRLTTLMAVLSYVVLLGCVKWPAALTRANGVQTVPRYHQVIVAMGLLLTGITLGQVLRLARRVTKTAREGALP